MNVMTPRFPDSARKRRRLARWLATFAAVLGVAAGCAVKSPPSAVDIQKEA